jgi:gluconolactonase
MTEMVEVDGAGRHCGSTWSTATTFAKLPDELSQLERMSPWAAQVLDTSHVKSFFEGPCITPDGDLLVSDLAHGRIFVVSPTGEFSVYAACGGEPNGMAFDRSGALFVADYQNGIVRYDPATGHMVLVADRYRHERFHGVSDLVFSSTGALYFTDQGQSDLAHPDGRVFELRPDGDICLLMDRIPSPNGIALSLDESTLYVAVTRANAVYRIPLLSSSKVGKVGIHLNLSGGSGGPDGLAVDSGGWLAVARYGMGRVTLFDDTGVKRQTIEIPTGLGVTNICFSLTKPQLFITEASSGSIMVADVPHVGKRALWHE